MSDASVSLEQLAGEINELHWQIEEAGIDKRLELAERLVSTQKQVGQGKAWEDWADKSLDLSRSYRNEMLRIGNATNQKAELEKVRKETRDRVRKHRETLRNGGTNDDDDTHIIVNLPKALGECPNKKALLSRLDFQRENKRWRICITKAAEEDAA